MLYKLVFAEISSRVSWNRYFYKRTNNDEKDSVIVFTKSFELYLFILFQTRSKPMSRSVMVLKTTSSLKDLIESHYFGFFDRVWHSLLTWDRAHRARSEYWSYSTSCPCDKRKGSVVNRTKFFKKNVKQIRSFKM